MSEDESSLDFPALDPLTHCICIHLSSSYCDGRSVLACGYTLHWTFQSPLVLKNLAATIIPSFSCFVSFFSVHGSHPCAYKDLMLLLLKTNTFPRAHNPFQTLFFCFSFSANSLPSCLYFLSLPSHLSFSLTPIGPSIPPSHWKFSHFAQSIH